MSKSDLNNHLSSLVDSFCGIGIDFTDRFPILHSAVSESALLTDSQNQIPTPESVESRIGIDQTLV